MITISAFFATFCTFSAFSANFRKFSSFFTSYRRNVRFFLKTNVMRHSGFHYIDHAARDSGKNSLVLVEGKYL
jgi:hypothetical protein